MTTLKFDLTKEYKQYYTAKSTPVAGEIVPLDKLSIFLSTSWILILLILALPIAYLLYRKRDATLKLLSPLSSKLFEFTQRL